jgi:N utilization substance protein A
VAALDVDEEMAALLVEVGFNSVEEIAYVPLEEMLAIEGFDEELANELRARAKDALLTSALTTEEQATAKPAEDLLKMDGMNDALAQQLAYNGIISMEDLAEQAVDELVNAVPDLDEKQAAALIMTARAPWFK